MPRTARIEVPHYPHHIVQRGHDRNAVFVHHDDFTYYLDTLRECKREFDVKVFAYCLMTNHVHLLLAPSENGALGKLMKRLAGRQTRYRNRLEGRSGTLWEGRYKSSPVDDDTYLLACCRYIEMNPIRARMVATPLDYPWSSYRDRVGHSDHGCLDSMHPYIELGVTDQERRRTYENFIMSSVPDGEWEFLREAVRRNQLTGNDRFVDQVSKAIGRRVERRGPGRPSLKK
jgi:putative transposase